MHDDLGLIADEATDSMTDTNIDTGDEK